MNKEKNYLLVLLTAIILIVLFGITLIILNKKGFLTFSKNDTSEIPKQISNTQNDSIVDNSNENKNINNPNKSDNSSMSYDEVFDLWKKIKGNWGHVNYDAEHNLCSGTSLEINTNVKIAKFNSDGITTWNILSFDKLNDDKYKINLVLPVNLNNEMSGDIKANYNSITLDISKLGEKKLIANMHGSNIEFDYVSENKVIIDETTHFQYVDVGLKQDDYCNWFKKN